MQLLGTNLLTLMEGNLLPHKATKTTKKLVEKAVAVEVQEISATMETMINAMYEECKTAKNFNEVLEKHADSIAKINKAVESRQVQIKLENGYMRGYWNNIQMFYVSLGNAKLVPNQYGEGFVIWSIAGKITCNGKTELCGKACYNTCRSYEKTIKTKLRNAIFTQLDCFVDVMVKVVKKAPYDKTFFRIHEDGDFFDTAYFDKWVQVAKGLENEKAVLMAYTKEPALMPEINKINASQENMVLRFSIMEDTAPEIIEYVNTNKIPTYICLGTKKKDKQAKEIYDQIKFASRCMDSCKHCKKCYIKHDSLRTLFTKMH